MNDEHLVRHKYYKTEERVYSVAVPMDSHGERVWITAFGHRVYPEWVCKLTELYGRDIDMDVMEKVIT